jgi:hypothetical protein
VERLARHELLTTPRRRLAQQSVQSALRVHRDDASGRKALRTVRPFSRSKWFDFPTASNKDCARVTRLKVRVSALAGALHKLRKMSSAMSI